MVLLMSGDIHPSSGPANTHSMYPCRFCELQVTWTHRAVCCDQCDIWYHKSCISMLSAEYQEIHDVSWSCVKCKTQNIASFTYHLYDVSMHNQFETLSGIPGDDSVFLSPAAFNPSQHKSPLNTRVQPLMSSVVSTQATSDNTSTINPLPHKANNLRIAVINCQGVCNKRAELENMYDYMDPDVRILTETKLDPSVNLSEFLPEHYM